MGACPKQPKRNPLLVGGLRAYAPYGPQNFLRDKCHCPYCSSEIRGNKKYKLALPAAIEP